MGSTQIETRGGRPLRPGYLLGALVAGVMAVALTSTWWRREETVGDGLVAVVYGVLALVLWIATGVSIALGLGFGLARGR